MSGKGAFVVVGAGPGLGAAAARRIGREGHDEQRVAPRAGHHHPAQPPHLIVGHVQQASCSTDWAQLTCEDPI
ncbi:hypothetical protein [Streptomyces sp. NPDC054765]